MPTPHIFMRMNPLNRNPPSAPEKCDYFLSHEFKLVFWMLKGTARDSSFECPKHMVW